MIADKVSHHFYQPYRFYFTFFLFILDWQGSFLRFSLSLSLSLSCLLSYFFLSQCYIHTTVFLFTEYVNAYQIDKFSCMLLWTEIIITLIFFLLFSFVLYDYRRLKKAERHPSMQKWNFERIIIEL